MKVIRHEDRLWVSVEDHQKAVEFARVAAAIVEREECAKVADDYVGADLISDAIRARGQNDS